MMNAGKQILFAVLMALLIGASMVGCGGGGSSGSPSGSGTLSGSAK